ncbi:indolepyruvate oxidoreductase subunit beta [Promethearchaeum syntrophicum]|uniref:Indolepyruvate oxidoreductase subunit beta n=1 Tax=Promethearchaeum syntrophicum TaxID=2594042 RepID=A0A5B9DCF8_9ARCH|nr:indolepyruvate oxidoreductase subunit beta [Candidatus Prometheoarchaeum syntrophicum]QEE16695.1 Indolepyruvate oxidoreductase subunit IorB [Candidatus Prometheoarchaeum syntrophicum]
MNIDKFNILSVGVGGQGVIRVTQILASAALLDDYHVRTAETHGMAQRGGSVSGYLRFGEHVDGPLIPAGLADIIIALEPLEAVRNMKYVGKKSIILLNDKQILPLSIYQSKKIVYPKFDEILANLKKITTNVFFIKATELAEKAGNAKTSNVIMLGVIFGTGILPLSKENLEKSILKYVPSKAIEVNKIAFNIGIEEGQKMRSELN